MKTKSKSLNRILTILLALCMILSAMPTSIFADDGSQTPIEAAKAELQVLAESWELDALDHDLDLPDTTSNGCEIEWTSSRNTNTPGLSNAGVIKRPTITGTDTSGTLTAKIYYQSDSDSIVFNYTLKKVTEEELSAAVKTALEDYLPDLSAVTGNLNLFEGEGLNCYPTQTSYMKGIVLPVVYGGVSNTVYVTVEGSDNTLIGEASYSGSAYGKNGIITLPVTRPTNGEGDKAAKLTFTFKANASISWSEEIDIKVLQNASEAELAKTKTAALEAMAAIEEYDGSNSEAIEKEVEAAEVAVAAAINAGWTASEVATWANYEKIATSKELLANMNYTVTLTVQGYNKGDLYPDGDGSEVAYFIKSQPFVVKEGWTVYDVLKAAADYYGMELGGTSSYVSGIAGLNEKMLGSTSGWMYMVNTTGYISVGMGAYKISDGDDILIYYVKGWGDGPMCSFDNIKDWSEGKDAINLLSQDDKASLEEDWAIIKADLDACSSWRNDLSLPVRGESGSKITWSSSDPAVISSSGKLTMGEEAQTVTLTAKLYLGEETLTKTYNVNVGSSKGISVTVNIEGKDEASSLATWTGLVSGGDLTSYDSTVTYTAFGNNIMPAHALMTRLKASDNDFAFNDNTGLKSSSGSYASAGISYLFGINNASGRYWSLRVTDKDGNVKLESKTSNQYFVVTLSDGDVVTFRYIAKISDLNTALTKAKAVGEDLYTAESYGKLKTAMDAGQEIYDQGYYADQTEVDAATEAINTAIDELEASTTIDKALLNTLLENLQTSTKWQSGNGDGFGVLALQRAGLSMSESGLSSFISGADSDFKATSTARPSATHMRSAIGMTALGYDLNYYVPTGGTNTALNQFWQDSLKSSQTTVSVIASWLILNDSGSYPEKSAGDRDAVTSRLISGYKDSLGGWASSLTGTSFSLDTTCYGVMALAPAYFDEADKNHEAAVTCVSGAIAKLKTQYTDSTSLTNRALISLALLSVGEDPEEVKNGNIGLISSFIPNLLADKSGFADSAYSTTYTANTPTVVLAIQSYLNFKETGKAQDLSSYSSYDLAEEKSELKTEVDTAKTYAEENYTKESYEALTKAIDEAEVALVSMNTSADQLKTLKAAIKDAETGLQLLIDKSELEALIKEAEAIDESIAYTDESKEILAAVLEEAKRVYADESALQQEINQTCELLQEALDQLYVEGEEDIAEIIKTITASWISDEATISDDWRVVDMAMLGREDELFDSEEALRTYVSSAVNRINPNSVTDYERVLLALTALGIDGSKLDEYRTFYDSKGNVVTDLVAAISSFSADELSVNGAAYGLLAYDSGDYQVGSGAWSRDNLISYLLNCQLADGGWNLVGSGSADPDVTAIVISALAPYETEKGLSSVLSNAVSCLSSMQSKTGTFSSYDTVNSNSASMVMIALASMGIDANKDENFLKWSKGVQYSALDGLLTFKTSSNFFGYDSSSSSNAMSTEQGLRALAAYRSYLYAGSRVQPYYFGTPATTEKWEEQAVATSLAINKLPSKTTYQIGEAFDATGIDVTVTFSDGTSINPDASKLTFVGFDSTTSGTRSIRVSFDNAYATFDINVAPGSTSTTKTVYLRVADPQGKTYLARTAYTMEDGETAFSLLGKSGLSYSPNWNSSYSGVYVEAIEGLGEFDMGPQSGWMYRVNGVFPSYSSSLYLLKDGDYVEWLYTRDLGADLGNTQVGSGEQSAPTITLTDAAGNKVTDRGSASYDSNTNTVTITPAEGYVVKDVLVGGVSKGSVTTLSGISAGDVITVIFEAALPDDDPLEDPVVSGVSDTQIKLKSTLGKGYVKLTWTKSKGYKVDYYEVYRSTKRYSGYGKTPIFTTKTNKTYYKNTKGLKKGTRYYYKVRGVRVLDGKKIYTKYSNKAWRTVK